ncbi:hypothetical protein L208DRAFT_879978 [Tricholoma matsutake]|nr:hypothetical protein L208DRAFT_879978 [Tricholoma matsutake 945]
MTTFTFKDKNILTSRLESNHGSGSFTTHTTYRMIGLGRKETTVIPDSGAYVHDSVGSGSINWKNKTFEIGGVVKRVADLNRRPSFFRRTREWQWSGRQFTVEYSYRENRHTVTSGTVCASMTPPYELRLFTKVEPASISFLSDLSKEDMMFLFLVLLYSETRRKDNNMGAGAA